MNPDKRAGALAIQIKIADVKFAARAFQLGFVSRVHRACQAKLGVIGYSQRVVVVVGFDHRQHRSKDFFLFDRRAGFHVRDHRRLDEESLFAIGATARDDAPALGLSFFDVAVD